MISKSFIAILFLALTSSVNAATVPVFIGRDGEVSVASAPLARRQTPSSAAAVPTQTSESIGKKVLHGAEDVLGLFGGLIGGDDE